MSEYDADVPVKRLVRGFGLLEDSIGSGASVLGRSGYGTSSFGGMDTGTASGLCTAGRGVWVLTGVLSSEGASGFATVSLPEVGISSTDNDSDERRSFIMGVSF